MPLPIGEGGRPDSPDSDGDGVNKLLAENARILEKLNQLATGMIPERCQERRPTSSLAYWLFKSIAVFVCE